MGFFTVAYITALIFELLQANYTNNISANEHFLDNMYRIVSISLTTGAAVTLCFAGWLLRGLWGGGLPWARPGPA